MTFHGELGLFRELPKPEEISDYSIYMDLNRNIQIREDEIDEENITNLYKF